MTNAASASLNDLYAAAIEAEKNGVPVSWKDMYMSAISYANTYIASVEKKAADLEARIAELEAESR